jgi:hypothetical protein
MVEAVDDEDAVIQLNFARFRDDKTRRTRHFGEIGVNDS